MICTIAFSPTLQSQIRVDIFEDCIKTKGQQCLRMLDQHDSIFKKNLYTKFWLQKNLKKKYLEYMYFLLKKVSSIP